MKTIKFLVGCLLIGVFSFSALAQEAKPKKTETIKIKTSAQCEMCKERIEKAMRYEKGVKKAVLNLDTKELEVVYQPKKTDLATIRKAVSKTGYDADEVAAEKEPYDKLPACCKKVGVSN